MNNYEIKFTYIISKYIKQYIKPILLFILFTLVFSLVFVLYNISTEPVIYASLLCCFIGLICICINFINYYKKHIALYKLQNEIYISLNNLPTPKNLIEDDYTNLILNLNDEYKNFISKSDNAQKDMIDYYTMWVHQIKTPISAMKLLIQTSECEVSSDLSSELFKIEQYVEMVLSYIRLGSSENDFLISVSGELWMDFMNVGVNKGTAIERIQEYYDVTYDETMAFGDYLNDYEMMQSCKYSYAMANAHPKLKEVSNYEAKSNDENGVVEVIKEYFEI